MPPAPTPVAEMIRRSFLDPVRRGFTQQCGHVGILGAGLIPARGGVLESTQQGSRRGGTSPGTWARTGCGVLRPVDPTEWRGWKKTGGSSAIRQKGG